MSISTNYIICAAILIVAAIAIVIILIQNSKKDDKVLRKEYRTIWDVVNMIKDYFVEMLGADISEDVTDEEFDRLYRRVAKIRTANKNATFGMDAAKALIKDIIAGAINDTLLDTEIDNILGLNAGQIPSIHVMFESMMQVYKVRYGKSALEQWINTYKLAEPHMHNGSKRYYISIEDVYQAYMTENIQFTKKEKVKLLATLVYQLYRGFGIIDTIREMNIDGLNIGTSGSILSNLEGSTIHTDALKPEEEATRGCWLYFHGRYIHLRFVNFGSQDEIKRIVNLLVRYNSSGALTAKRGYMVNTMYDKSRLLAFRPPVAEYYAAFIRKFTLSSITVDSLICKDNVENAETVRDLIRHLIYGLTTTIVTGRQGSGKTTLMSAMIDYIDPVYNIRVLEMAPELYLRELYKDRNILSAQETAHVTASEIQNAFKKSDSAVSICGEIANASLCSRFIEFGRVASIMNIATHHANTTRDLVLALRNNLLEEATGGSPESAEQQVIEIVKIDIHLDYTKDGFRYVDRISEIVPLASEPYETFDYKMPKREDFEDVREYELALKAYELSLREYNSRLNREYYTRSTDREAFAVNQLLHFDLKTMTYIVDNPPTQALIARMKMNMTQQQIKDLDTFLLEHYEIRDAEDLIIDLTPDELTEAASDGVDTLDLADLDAAEEMIALLGNDKPAEDNVTSGMIDMTDAIDLVRHRGGEATSENQFNYSEPEEDILGGQETLDKLVQIDSEEDARKHAELYAPTSPEAMSQMIEAERHENNDTSAQSELDALTENMEEVVSPEAVELENLLLGTEEKLDAEQSVEEQVTNVFDTLNQMFGTGETSTEQSAPIKPPANNSGSSGKGKKRRK